MPTDRRKQALYLPQDMIAEMRAEARRLDRPIAWVAQQALRAALPVMRERGCPVPIGGRARRVS